MKPVQLVTFAALALFPVLAHAQRIPLWAAVGALSPLFMLVLAALLGWLARSWRTAAAHAGLVLVWVVLFVTASRYADNDYVIWTPLVLYGAHGVLILALLVQCTVRRFGITERSRDGAA